MDKVTFKTIELPNGEIIENAFIEREDGSTVSMLKSTWDELEAQKELGGTL